MGVIYLGTLDAPRDHNLQTQLQLIADAQTVEDFKTILEQLVRVQRHDYR